MSGYFGLPFRKPWNPPAWGNSTAEPVASNGQNPLSPVITYTHRPESTRINLPSAAGGGTGDLHTYFSRGHNTDCHPCTSAGNDNLNDIDWLCNVWPKVFSDASGGNRRVPEADRTFDAAGASVRLNTCGLDYGFQSRQAGRRWHGSYGFDVVPGTNGTLCSGGRSTMKYLNVSVSLVFAAGYSTEDKTVRDHDGFVYSDSTESYSGGDSVIANVTTNANSGERTRNSTISTPGYTRTINGSTDYPTYVRFSGVFNASVPANFTNFGVNCGTYSLLGYSFPDLASISAYITTDLVYGDLVPTVSAGTISGGWKFHVEYQFFPKTTVTHFTGSEANPSLPGSTNWTHTVSGTGTASMVFEYILSGENSLFSVDADAMSLLTQWDFSNKQHFPWWRKDSAMTVAPFSGRNEADTANDPLSVVAYVATMDDYNAGPPGGPWPQIAWKDPTCWQWVFPYGHNQGDSTGNLIQIHDGTPIGAPLPLGYGMPSATNTNDGIIDLKNGVWTETDCHGTPDWLSYGSGTPIELPRHCSKWTPANIKAHLYPCSFISHEGFANYDVYIQELIEVQIPTRSHDWMRPYGEDRLLLDYTTATCSGSTLSASLRYPTAPPFGLCKISSATFDGINTTFVFSPSAVWGSDTSWSVDIYNGTTNSSGVLVPESTAVATATMTSSNTVAGNYSNAKFFCPAGKKPWTCDTQRKGDYVTREAYTAWDGTVTDGGTVQRTASKSAASCCAVTLSLPLPTPNFNWLLYRGCITQWMTDPIYRAGKYCDAGGNLFDNVICLDNVPSPPDCTISICDVPFEEARTAPPTTGGWTGTESAPAVLDGTDISNCGEMPGAGEPTTPRPWQIYLMCRDAGAFAFGDSFSMDDKSHF